MLTRKKLISFLTMARPLLLLIVSPVYLIGNLIARAAGFQWDSNIFWWGLLTLLPAVIAANYANEYADFQTDALTERTPFSGGSGVLAQDASLRRTALWAVWFFTLIGATLAWAGLRSGALNTSALFLWVLGTFVGIAYSLPPFKLAWRGWSEVLNALLIGLLLPLYGYTVQSGNLNWQVVVGCIPFALLVFVFILSTNWADREADRVVGKYTLSARLTQTHLRRLYAGSAFLGFALQPFLVGAILPKEVVLSSLPAIPFLIWAGTRYTRIHSPLPTVTAILILLPLQLAAWIIVGM
jgi:1,4-dihydroxy-2-naphthoate octaprenyltransferase